MTEDSVTVFFLLIQNSFNFYYWLFIKRKKRNLHGTKHLHGNIHKLLFFFWSFSWTGPDWLLVLLDSLSTSAKAHVFTLESLASAK